MTVRRRYHGAVATVLVTLLAACVAPRPNLRKPEAEPEQDSNQGFALVLHNHHFLDVNIFVQHDGQATRVGTVTGSSSLAMELPLWLLGETRVLRLIAEPIGDNTRYVTDNLTIQPGQVIELNVESQIARSNYSVQ